MDPTTPTTGDPAAPGPAAKPSRAWLRRLSVVVIVGVGLLLLAPKAPRDYDVDWELGALGIGLRTLSIVVRTAEGQAVQRSVYNAPPAFTHQHQHLRVPPGSYRAELTLDYGDHSVVRDHALSLGDEDVVTLEP